MRQALCIHNFLEDKKTALNYEHINDLLTMHKISVEWIYLIDLVLKEQHIPEDQTQLDGDTTNHTPDQTDGIDIVATQAPGIKRKINF